MTTMTSNAILNKNYSEKCEGEKFEKIKKNFTKHADKMVAHCLLSSSHDKGDDASNEKYSDDIENIQIMVDRSSEHNEYCLLSSSNDKGGDTSNKKYSDDIENKQITENKNDYNNNDEKEHHFARAHSPSHDATNKHRSRENPSQSRHHHQHQNRQQRRPTQQQQRFQQQRSRNNATNQVNSCLITLLACALVVWVFIVCVDGPGKKKYNKKTCTKKSHAHNFGCLITVFFLCVCSVLSIAEASNAIAKEQMKNSQEKEFVSVSAAAAQNLPSSTDTFDDVEQGSTDTFTRSSTNSNSNTDDTDDTADVSRVEYSVLDNEWKTEATNQLRGSGGLLNGGDVGMNLPEIVEQTEEDRRKLMEWRRLAACPAFALGETFNVVGVQSCSMSATVNVGNGQQLRVRGLDSLVHPVLDRGGVANGLNSVVSRHFVLTGDAKMTLMNLELTGGWVGTTDTGFRNCGYCQRTVSAIFEVIMCV